MKSKYIRSLDGIRTLAVLVVIVYHFNSSILPGGFLGVDIFFVLSGFLITRQIHEELAQTKKFKFSNFYLKRVKRLVPAMLLTISGVSLLVLVLAPFSMPQFKESALYGLLGLENWYQINAHLDYFSQSVIPQGLKHFWSLAVEIQFYLFFPFIYVVIYKLNHGKKGGISKYLLGLSLISLISMVCLFAIKQDISRVYYGTDTRAFALIIGGIFGINYEKILKQVNKQSSLFITMLGLTMSLLLVTGFLLINEKFTILYYGGFYIFAWFIGFYLTIISSEKNKFKFVFANQLCTYIASRSYAMYLWHYPLIVFISKEGKASTFLFVALLIMLISEYSYRMIEEPILKKQKKAFVYLGQYVLITLIVFCIPYNFYCKLSADEMVKSKNEETALSVFKKYQNRLQDPLEKIELIHNDFEQRRKSSIKIDDYNVIMVGDSIIEDVKEEAANVFPNLKFEAKVGLQFYDEIKILHRYAKYDDENTVIIFNCGSNGNLTSKELDQVRADFKKSHIFVINSAVKQPWSYETNAVLNEYVKKYPQFNLLNWQAVASGHPEYITGDQIHLTEEGERVYTNFIYRGVMQVLGK